MYNVKIIQQNVNKGYDLTIDLLNLLDLLNFDILAINESYDFKPRILVPNLVL